MDHELYKLLSLVHGNDEQLDEQLDSKVSLWTIQEKRINKERGCTVLVTRAWSWIGIHSLIFVTWQRNWFGAGGDWADLGKSFE
jgi:hypothetical protein